MYSNWLKISQCDFQHPIRGLYFRKALLKFADIGFRADRIIVYDMIDTSQADPSNRPTYQQLLLSFTLSLSLSLSLSFFLSMSMLDARTGFNKAQFISFESFVAVDKRLIFTSRDHFSILLLLLANSVTECWNKK